MIKKEREPAFLALIKPQKKNNTLLLNHVDVFLLCLWNHTKNPKGLVMKLRKWRRKLIIEQTKWNIHFSPSQTIVVPPQGEGEWKNIQKTFLFLKNLFYDVKAIACGTHNSIFLSGYPRHANQRFFCFEKDWWFTCQHKSVLIERF